MLRKITLVVFAILLAAFSMGRVGAVSAAPAHQAGPQTFTIMVGGEAELEPSDMGMSGAWQIMHFYPDKITVNEGDTIVWKINSSEFHEVIFPAPGQTYVPFIVPDAANPQQVDINPLAAFPTGGANYDGTAAASSGLISRGAPGVPEYKLTFTKAGTYNYLCATHSSQLPNGQVVGMTASVTVQAAGSTLPKTPDQVTADAQAAMSADAQAASASDADAKKVTPAETMSDGTMKYHVNIGYDEGNFSYMRFAPTDLTVHVGDTIEWTQASTVTPHTVTLLSGAPDPEVSVAQPQPSGPPKVLLNPAILAPAGGTTYDGTGISNSGFMPGTQDPTPGPRTYSLTFTQPGTYEYVCSLHDAMGMSGHITVLAAGSTPGMPSTGNAERLPWAAALGALTLLVVGASLRRKVRYI